LIDSCMLDGLSASSAGLLGPIGMLMGAGRRVVSVWHQAGRQGHKVSDRLRHQVHGIYTLHTLAALRGLLLHCCATLKPTSSAEGTQVLD
jgi:hypothetical protein